jgi:hypothetical protein
MEKLCEASFKISNADKKVLDHYSFVEIKEWAHLALNGLLNRAYDNIFADWIEIFKEQSTRAIPADKKELVHLIIRMPGFVKYKKKSVQMRKSKTKGLKRIEVLKDGFDLNDEEFEVLTAFYENPQQFILDLIENKIAGMRKKFIDEFQNKMLRDPEIKVIPPDEDDFILMVTGTVEYQNNLKKEGKKNEI